MRPSIERLEDRDCPSVIYDHGGPVLPHPQYDNLYVAGAPNEDGATRVIATEALQAISRYYPIGTGALRSSSTLPYLGPFVSDYSPDGGVSPLQAVILADIIFGGAPLPSGQDVYVLHLEKGEHVLSPQGQWDIGLFAGYHGTIYAGPVAIPYAVVLDQGDPARNSMLLDHEDTEAALDPWVINQLGLGTGYQSAPPFAFEAMDVYPWKPWVCDGYVMQVGAGPDLQRIDSLPQ